MTLEAGTYTVSARLEGIDLVLEGEATRVTDRSTLEEVARLYREGGWPADVEGDALVFDGQEAVALRLIDTRTWDGSENVLVRYDVRRQKT